MELNLSPVLLGLGGLALFGIGMVFGVLIEHDAHRHRQEALPPLLDLDEYREQR